MPRLTRLPGRSSCATRRAMTVCASMVPNAVPRFREGLGEIQALFERILEQTFGVSEGIWIGTPVNLTLERESRELERRMPEIAHPHLVVWGEGDGWIAPADLRTMLARIRHALPPRDQSKQLSPAPWYR